MKPEKFDNKVKNLLEEREIKPSSQSWEQLEQRLEQKKKSSKPIFLWVGAAAAVAIVFFTLGTYFNSPIQVDAPQIVEEPADHIILEEKKNEPEILQVAAAEEKVVEKKISPKEPSKNIIFEAPVRNASEEDKALASEISSEAPDIIKMDNELLLAENPQEMVEVKVSAEVTETEVEALLLLATAELESDPAYTVDSNDLLHQVEYELDQSFRQKVFEVVKEGFSKAKTAVANRDF